MSEDGTRFMEFKALGSNCVDCGFSLSGRIYTIGSEICLKIEQELRGGTLDIDIQGDRIQFVFEGVTIGFSERPERLLAIKQMLEPGRHVYCEPYKNADSSGFALMARD